MISFRQPRWPGRLGALLCACSFLAALPVHAQEWGLDLGVASSTVSESWGVAAHGQLIYGNNLGFDLGYRYLDQLSYEAFDEDLVHRFAQYEAGLLWQEGRDGARFQAIAGVIMAGYRVETGGGETVINRFTPGYRLDADLSVPFIDRLRVFANLGYQGFYGGELPNQWRWRYGFRLTLGGERQSELERVRLAQQEAARRAEAQRQEEGTQQVPDYIPRHLSQSLPPIVELSEVCKCFPAGPYTLQLGEFRSMEQAVRALEYRGLRQLFNTVAYERSPQPVFLAQSQPDGPVAFFLGEYDALSDTEYWRRELRRNGIEGRLRRVVGSEGRIANRIRSVEDPLAPTEGYTEEQIARMNSLAEPMREQGITPPAIPGQTSPMPSISERTPIQLAAEEPVSSLADSLIIGPLAEAATQLWLADADFRRQWLVPEDGAPRQRVRLVWDASNKQGWYFMDRFSSELALSQTRVWLDGLGLSYTERRNAAIPGGDIYLYRLGVPAPQYRVQLASEDDPGDMWRLLLSPEVLWFQAFQAINDRPADLVLNWPSAQQGYQLLATGFNRQSDAEAAWRHLVSVGLQPGPVR